MIILSIPAFIAKLHPVVVHLPIGILVLAVLFQWLSQTNRYAYLQPAIPVAMFWGMLGAVIACVSGYLLSLNGGYDDVIAGRHQWMGIAVAIFSFLLYLLYKLFLGSPFMKWLSLVLLGMIIFTGHLGGTLTHGEGYLTGAFGENEVAPALKPIDNPQEAVLYADVVQPIMQARCYSCHGKTKQKGELRLDSPDALLKGGEDGKVIIPGKADESELIKRIFLPVGDDDHMPPESRPQLTENEVLLLHWWVNTGADFSKKIKELPATEKIRPVIAALQTGESIAPDAGMIPAEEAPPADIGIVNALREKGVVVIPVAKNSNYLLANFVTAQSVSDTVLALLPALKKQLVWLMLDNAAIDDRALARVAECTSLTRLQLGHTNVSDAGISSLRSLERLQSLNLVGTKVTANGLASLAGSTELKNIYIYQSGVKPSDLATLKQKFPNARIDTGGYVVPTLEKDTTEVKF